IGKEPRKDTEPPGPASQAEQSGSPVNSLPDANWASGAAYPSTCFWTPQPHFGIPGGSIANHLPSGDSVTHAGAIVDRQERDPAIFGQGAQDEHVAAPAGDSARREI